MSKLGNVYELDFNTRMKNKYPVVYINDGYIVCKCNGTNIPKVFKRNDGSIYVGTEVLDYAVFKALSNPLEHRKFYILYVPNCTNETFSEFFVQADGIWCCVPESGFDGLYFLSEENQDTLNYLRKFEKLEEIVNDNNE